MMKLFLAPEDVWLFRDGRPFDAGTSHRARSLFPPYPSALQGAIRSHQLALMRVDLSNKKNISAAVGTTYDFHSLRMRGPFLAKYDGKRLTRYFPCPADWFPLSKDSLEIRALPPQERKVGELTSLSTSIVPLLFFSGDFQPGKREYGKWLCEEDLHKYLNGEAVRSEKSEAFFIRESRVGLQLKTKARTANEGMLYEAEFIRPFSGVGLYVEFEGYDDWPVEGLLRLGGEGHAARYRHVEAKPWPNPPDPLPERFKVYFAPPAFFKRGWQPESWELFFEGKVHLQAIALSGYETTGGYDYAAHDDKPGRRYVPAGSVYYFNSSGKAYLKPGPEEQFAITERDSQIGFGQIIIKEWKNTKE